MSPRSLLLRRAEVSDVECKGRKGESSLGRRMQGVADAQLAPQVTRAEKEELFKIRTRHSNGQERCFCCNAEEIRGESLPYIHPSFPALFTRAMPGELFARSFHTSHTRKERERKGENGIQFKGVGEKYSLERESGIAFTSHSQAVLFLTAKVGLATLRDSISQSVAKEGE